MKRITHVFAVPLALSLLAGCANAPASATAGNETTAGVETAAGNESTTSTETAQDQAESVQQSETSAYTYADTIAWDGQYDVIVAGFGGAGAMAAKNAADEGASVLIVEKAPAGSEGGNTRFCHQMFVDGGGDYESTLTYFKALGGKHSVPDAMLEVYASSIANMADVTASELGLNKDDFKDWGAVFASVVPEYPELPGGSNLTLYAIHDGKADSALWKAMRQNVTDRSDKIDVWFESPAVGLIQDPQSKTILGVKVERDGQVLNIQAVNGVVLATGGFENNDEMVQTYLGLDSAMPIGTLYNTGDGIRMAMEVGADLWHMEVYESGNPGSALIPEEGEHAEMIMNSVMKSGSSIFVSVEGTRFIQENVRGRHGRVNHGGVWLSPRYPSDYYCVMDAANYTRALELGLNPSYDYDAYGALLDPDYAYTYQGDTIEELANVAGINAENLAVTIANFNTYAETGVDPEQGRSAESMTAFGDGPYYALKIQPNILNTQGGPRRNENAEILDHNGNPIPHLYSAGELGGICSFQYQGGGNMAECIIFGSIAGKNAAVPKEELPAYVVPAPVESSLAYTPGMTSDIKVSVSGDVQLADNEILGEGIGMGGTVVVKVTFDGDLIGDVEVIKHSETPGKSDPAIEQIPERIIEAQSTEVDSIAGATITSDAIKQAVNDALEKR